MQVEGDASTATSSATTACADFPADSKNRAVRLIGIPLRRLTSCNILRQSSGARVAGTVQYRNFFCGSVGSATWFSHLENALDRRYWKPTVSDSGEEYGLKNVTVEVSGNNGR